MTLGSSGLTYTFNVIGTDSAGNTIITASNGKISTEGATLGQNTTQQHTIPAVAGDTFTLNNAAQTLLLKTLTNPTVTSGAFTNPAITSASIDGSTINNAPQLFTSYSNAGVGLGTTNAYFPITGIGASPNITSTAQYGGVMPVGGVLRRFATFLNAAASGGTRTFTVLKNNAATDLVITYGSAQLNAKTATGSANFVAGDYLEILSSVNGTPVNNAGGQFAVFATINNS